ncbi:MAG: hypothetical protein HYV63_17170 [Candidatus Schekmanbacteria bacterium]|nr:hypothetical protein [Candidatus Schekmanbacteria bacterium]
MSNMSGCRGARNHPSTGREGAIIAMPATFLPAKARDRHDGSDLRHDPVPQQRAICGARAPLVAVIVLLITLAWAVAGPTPGRAGADHSAAVTFDATLPPPRPPTSIRWFPLSMTHIILDFVPPVTRANGVPIAVSEIFGYRVYWTGNAELFGYRSPIKYATKVSMPDITGNVYVTALDLAGNESDRSAVLTGVGPLPPPILYLKGRGDDFLVIGWNLQPYPPGVFFTLDLRFRDTWYESAASTDPAAGSITLTDLDSCSYLVARARVRHELADGLISADLEASTTGDVPAMPRSFRAIPTGQNQVQIRWHDPSDGTNWAGCLEQGLELQRQTGDGEFAVVGQVVANVVTFADATLQPGIAYGYRIKALGLNGNSPLTETSRATTATDTTVTVSVPARDAETSALQVAGIRVEKGDRITAAVTGTICLDQEEDCRGGSASAGPGGLSSALCNKLTECASNRALDPVPGFPHGALIGRIGSAGSIFLVGSAGVAAPGSGALQLGINDWQRLNNSGEHSVRVDF